MSTPKHILWFLFLTCWGLATVEISLSTSAKLFFEHDSEQGVAPHLSDDNRSLDPTLHGKPSLKQDGVSLPIWGDDSGINFDAIEAYLNYSLQEENKGAKHNILYPPSVNPHGFPSPNVVYSIGRHQGQQNPSVFVDFNTRQASKRFMQNGRYKPLETLLVDSLEHLMNATSVRTKWGRLYQYFTTSNSGIPLLVNLDDHRHCSEGNLVYEEKLYNVPVWTVAAANPYQDYCHYSFPLPTYATIQLVKEIEQSTHEGPMNFAQQDANYPWNAKEPTLVWRGTSSGVAPLAYRTFKYNNNGTIVGVSGEQEQSRHRRRIREKTLNQIDPKNPATHPIRLQMVHQAMNKSGHEAKYNNNTTRNIRLLDIAYNPGIHQYYKDHFPHLKEKPYIKPMENFQNYKAVLDVDGNSWSERFARLLCMNSVVVKVEPEFVDYFFTEVKPWVHYVPVKQDSSDLWDIAQHIMEDDEEMQGIVRNARQWCQENMKYERLMEFVLDSLAFYVDMLDKHDPNWTEKWKDLLERTKKDRTWRPLTK